jgi:uncharacterized protein
MTRPPFHLAIPVDDLAVARAFYGGVLGLAEGRSADTWVDWDLHGHQLVTHVVGGRGHPAEASPAGAVPPGSAVSGAAGSGASVSDTAGPGAAGSGVAGSGPVTSLVDGHDVPVPHFGLVLAVPEFHALAGRLRAAGTRFVIEPHVRFPGEPGEQWTMFLHDPAGNALEFKAFADEAQLFAT